MQASNETKIERYLQRISASQPLSLERRAELATEARRRLACQISDDDKASLSDFILVNNDPLPELERQINELWPVLRVASIQNHSRS